MAPSAPRDFDPVGPFAIRAPLLPFDTLVEWGADLEAATAPDETLADAIARDQARLVGRLRALVTDPVVREALFCASPSLDQAIDAWLTDPSSARARGVTPILVRYLARMCGRATPFGLFSSCAIGRVSTNEATALPIDGVAGVRRHTRLDMHYLTDLVEALQRQPALRAVLRYRPSTGLVRVGEHVHLAESDTERGARKYKLVSLDASAELDSALAAAASGALPDDIARAVVRENATQRSDDADEDHAVARAFVDELIDSQVLVSELEPRITGDEPIHHVLRVLTEHVEGREVAERLGAVRDALLAIDSAGLRGVDVGLASARFGEVAAILGGLPATVDVSRLFQVDLARPSDACRLGAVVMEEVERGIDLLRRFASRVGDVDLQHFRERFAGRYEEREIPLVEALDEELGIGFGATSAPPSGLIEGLPLGDGGGGGAEFSGRDVFVLKRVLQVLESGASTWELTAKDVEALEQRSGRVVPLDATSPGPAKLADVFACSVHLAATSREALDRGEFKAMVSSSGPLPMLLGRFCHGDPEAHRATRACIAAEESLQPDVVMAEIVHLPAGRIGNILCRPVLREYELTYLGASGAPTDKQIVLEDLLVSVHGGEVRLRSKRLDRWVLPRMTTAHNPLSTALSPYRFLCAVAFQATRHSLLWRWGAAGHLPRLPRVTSGRVVLAPAQWLIDGDQLDAVVKEKGAKRFAALRALRDERRLPRWVSFLDHADHVLPVDLENPLSCETFLELLKGRRTALLQEMFPSPSELVAAGPAGKYVTEVIVPFVSRRPRAPARPTRSRPRIERSFPPGSSWLFAKIYAGPTSVDTLLREVIAPLAREVIDAREATRWFFIRYDDPNHHVRVRFQGEPARLAALVPRLHARLAPRLAGGLAYRVTLDTYEREVERYGGDTGMELSEELFFHDSVAVAAALAVFDGARDADVRWRLAIVGMDRLLRGMGFDLEGRRAVLASLRASFGEEFFVRKPLAIELGARYRKVRGELDALLEGEAKELDRPLRAGLAAIDRRTKALAPVFERLLAASAAGQLTESVESLASSYLHMHANRMLAADHRAQELVLYDYLHRHYESRVARSKKGTAR